MILYHYSVDSYTGDPSLINDYGGHFRFTEPMLLALERGRETLYGAFYAAMYFSRELCDMKLRKYENYKKDAVEAVFEYVRRTRFADDSVSRQICVYYCDSIDTAKAYMYDDCLADGNFQKEQVKLLEVEVDATRVYRYDQTFYNRAIEAAERGDIDAAFSLAERYFAKERSETPLIEILSDGENHVLREIAF